MIIEEKNNIEEAPAEEAPTEEDPPEENQAEAALISWRGLCVARKYLSSLQEEFIDVAKIHLQFFKS